MNRAASTFASLCFATSLSACASTSAAQGEVRRPGLAVAEGGRSAQELVVAVTLQADHAWQVDEYRVVRGYGVRVDLNSGEATVADFGAPMVSDEAYGRVIPCAFGDEKERQLRSDQVLLDLMSGARSEAQPKGAFDDAADWFDNFPRYGAHLEDKMPKAVDWMRSARGEELAR